MSLLFMDVHKTPITLLYSRQSSISRNNDMHLGVFSGLPLNIVLEPCLSMAVSAAWTQERDGMLVSAPFWCCFLYHLSSSIRFLFPSPLPTSCCTAPRQALQSSASCSQLPRSGQTPHRQGRIG